MLAISISRNEPSRNLRSIVLYMTLVTRNSLQRIMDLISNLALVIFLGFTIISVKTLHREGSSDRKVRSDADTTLVLNAPMFVGIVAATDYSRRVLQKKRLKKMVGSVLDVMRKDTTLPKRNSKQRRSGKRI